MSREHCVACNQFSPTFDEVRAAARRAEALEQAFDRIDFAWKQRQSMPEWMAAMRTGIELARATLAGEGAPR